ncbi:MAG: glucose-6-phosphate isomerase [Planctomycetes bacterium]|nr:glucose-6-phosphate isomerase [Planctomycetota bacterium]
MTRPGSSERFDQYLRWRCVLEDPFVELDLSHGTLTETEVVALHGPLQKALSAMQELENGSIANADEQRMVGHYWLRAPGLAPQPETEDAIAGNLAAVEQFAAAVHEGRLVPPEGGRFQKVVLVGIGGSALGPMLLGEVFGPGGKLPLCVLDNTDPEGIDRALGQLGTLRDALIVVISKSGGTPETRNGMLEVERACTTQRLQFAGRAVAITMNGSALHQKAQQNGWLATFPMWDWVGGRTSLFSAVGLLPAALLGMDLRAFLAGAAAMDEATRRKDVRQNPAAMLASMWHDQGKGRGERAMVVLPYKDRLVLLSRYLQQLVMESLGKQHDRRGNVVHQGIAVYGNKGSTDQHAYVQQLRDGRHDFFALFVRVLRDRAGASIEVEPGVTSGDFLDGFWQGTRTALFENGRASATLVVEQLDERVLGALLALFERAVGLYAELIDINAYHQPGVEAGKKAAARVLETQRKVLAALAAAPADVFAVSKAAGCDPADGWPILCHLAANGRVQRIGPAEPLLARFAKV